MECQTERPDCPIVFPYATKRTVLIASSITCWRYSFAHYYIVTGFYRLSFRSVAPYFFCGATAGVHMAMRPVA